MTRGNFLIISLHAFACMKITTQSITGVTYMDHFNFEDRYRDIYECDPFYWHPLHLPEHCAEIFEKLIRSKIGSLSPVRVLAKANDFHITGLREDSSEYGALPPYEMMLESLKQDVVSHPRAPYIGMVPNVGPVAVYKQPISRTSENLIKRIGRMYAKTVNYYGTSGAFMGQLDVRSSTGNTRKGTQLNKDEKEKLKNIFTDPKIVKLKT